MNENDLDNILERIGCLIDTIDNYRMYGHNSPFTPVQRLDAMSHGLNSIREELFGIYADMGGEDVWEDNND